MYWAKTTALLVLIIVPVIATPALALQSPPDKLLELPVFADALKNIDGNYVSATIVIDKSMSSELVNNLYSKLTLTSFNYYGINVSLVASRLVKTKTGDYVFKVFGPKDLLVDMLSNAKGIMVKNAFAKPIPNMEEAKPIDEVLDTSMSGKSPELNNYFVRIITGARDVNSVYGITGSNIYVAVVDTGIDYGHPHLQSKLTYWEGYYIDVYGNAIRIREPLVLDADESQVILFRDFTALNGYINTSGYFYVITPWLINLTAPLTSYYVGNITSASGIYKFGVTYLRLVGAPSPVIRGVLLVDPVTPGNYTTLYIDFDNNGVFDSKDIVVTYDGNRILVSPNLTNPRYSLGVAGGFFHDIGWWFTNSYIGRFLPGWDLRGMYISIFYDFNGHGTACASAVGGVDTTGLMTGIAPGTKIIGVKALWFGNVEMGMLWAAGFDVNPNGVVYYVGNRRADVISNSWGISTFIYDISGFGYDYMSIFINGLTTPGYLDPLFPGVTVVQAAGNGGGGMGTVTAPGSAAGVITVGASTSFWPFYLLYRYGGFTWDQIISWSARGPTPIGYLKPDVVNVGAWGLTAYPVGWGRGPGSYAIFGGTSYATPLTAGAVALILEALVQKYGNEARNTPPYTIKQLLMNAADYLNYLPFYQGAGRVNAYRAVKIILESSEPILYSTSYYRNIYTKIKDVWYWYWSDYIPSFLIQWYGVFLRPSTPSIPSTWLNIPHYGIYVPDIPRGMSRPFDISVTNPYNIPIVVNFTAVRFTKKSSVTFTGNITLLKGMSDSSFYVIMDPSQIPDDVVLMEVEANLPFKYFDGDGDYVQDYELWVYSYIWLRDLDGNGAPYDATAPNKPLQVSEVAMFNYAYNAYSYNRFQISNPKQWLNLFRNVYRDVKLVLRARVWGGSGTDPTKGYPQLINVPITLTVTYYKVDYDTSIRLPSTTYTVFPGRSITVWGIVSTTSSTVPTVYQSYIKVVINKGNDTLTYYVPLTYTVVTSLLSNVKVTLNAIDDLSSPIPSSHLRGENNWAWRYESGDWRFFYVNIRDPAVAYLQVEVSWTFKNTSLISYVLGPDGFFAGAFLGQSVSWHRYLGGGKFMWFATGGIGRNLSTIIFPSTGYRYGFYPSQKPTLGVYTIIVRTALFDASTPMERFYVRVQPVTVPQRAPPYPMPSTYSTQIRVRFPYSVMRSSAIVTESPYPLFTSQSMNIRSYTVTPDSYPTRYYSPYYTFTYTVSWSNIGPDPTARKDLSILILVETPTDSSGLPVYMRYSSTYYLVTSTYVIEDWIITGYKWS